MPMMLGYVATAAATVSGGSAAALKRSAHTSLPVKNGIPPRRTRCRRRCRRRRAAAERAPRRCRPAPSGALAAAAVGGAPAHRAARGATTPARVERRAVERGHSDASRCRRWRRRRHRRPTPARGGEVPARRQIPLRRRHAPRARRRRHRRDARGSRRCVPRRSRGFIDAPSRVGARREAPSRRRAPRGVAVASGAAAAR